MITFKNDDSEFFLYYSHNDKLDEEYLFSSSTKLENEVYLLLLNDNIEPAYPFGSILCDCLNILKIIYDSYHEQNYDDFPNTVLSILDLYFPENSNEFNDLRGFIEYAFCCYHQELFDFDSLESNQTYNYFNFAQLCAKSIKHCNIEQLARFAALNSHPTPNRFLLSNDRRIRQIECKLSVYDIEGILSGYFNEQDAKYEYYDEAAEDHSAPVRSYEFYRIDSIADLIYVSLYELFSSHKFVNKCKNCDKFFIPKRFDTKYCDTPNPENNNRTCKQQVKLKNQLKHVQAKLSTRMCRSIDQMFRQKLEFNSDMPERCEKMRNEYYEFSDRSKKFKQDIKSGYSTEQQFEEWLKRFYVNKYKSK